MAIDPVANVLLFMNVAVHSDSPVFFQCLLSIKPLVVEKEPLLNGLFAPVTLFSFVLSPYCLAVKVDIAHVIFDHQLMVWK